MCSSGGSNDGDRTCIDRSGSRNGNDDGRDSVSVTEPMARAGDAAPVPAAVRFYVAHERAILGTLMVVLFLVAWEGLERGWWARLLHPLLGASPERWQPKPIFISPPHPGAP